MRFYMLENFDVVEYSSSRLEGDILGRIRNNFIKAINKEILLPKLIVVVMDNDVSRNIHFDNFRISKIFGENLNYMLNNVHRIILGHKDTLPARAKKYKYPTIMWITPPGHIVFSDNGPRQKFAKCVDTVAQLHNEMRVMKLKQWDFADKSLVVETNNMGGYRFTSHGLLKYWMSVDGAIQYWDTGAADWKKTPKFFKKKSQVSSFNNHWAPTSNKKMLKLPALNS